MNKITAKALPYLLSLDKLKSLIIDVICVVCSIILFVFPVPILADKFMTDHALHPVQAWIIAFCMIGLVWASQIVPFLRFGLVNQIALEKQYLAQVEKYGRLVRLTEKVSSSCKPGFIYLIRRADGIMKLGCTDNLDRRLQFHKIDYGAEFEIIEAWLVPNKAEYERMALRLTKDFRYIEGQRRELRRMTDSQLVEFVKTFDEMVERGQSEKQT